MRGRSVSWFASLGAFVVVAVAGCSSNSSSSADNADGGALDSGPESDARSDGAVVCEANASVNQIGPAAYDLSCSVDTDCVGVGFGNACSGPCAVLCVNAAINASTELQYRADVSRSGAGASTCFCPSEGRACCQTGMCTICPATIIPVTVDASTDASPE